MELEEFRSNSLFAVMSICLILSSFLCILASWKYTKVGGLFYLGVALTSALLLVKDLWYFGLYFTHQQPTDSFHYARVFIPLLAGGFLACLGIERFQVFSKAGLVQWDPCFIRFFMTGSTLLMLVLGICLLAYAYAQTGIDYATQRCWTKCVCICTMLYFLVVDLALSIMNFLLVMKMRLRIYQAGYRYDDPQYAYLLRKRTIYSVLSLLAMFIASTTGFTIFCFSTNILFDMSTIMFVQMYIVSAILGWQFTLKIVKL